MAKLARGLAFLTCANCFHLSPFKTSLLPMKLRHSTAKPCVIYELQDVITLQAGQRITSQCKLICRCFAQYWKNNQLHYMCGCLCSTLVLLGWLVRGYCFFFLCCNGIVNDFCFSGVLILTLLFQSCIFEVCMLVLPLSESSTFPVFFCLFCFRTGLFLLLIGCCLAYFLWCWTMMCSPCCCCFKGLPVFCRWVRQSGHDSVVRSWKTEMCLFSPPLLFHQHGFFWLWMVYIS